MQENSKPKKQVNIDSFTTYQIIGKGAYAKVFLAKKHGDDPNQFYAIKIMDIKYIQFKKQMNYIITEKNILIGMNHPFIIKLYYAFSDEKKLYLVLDYCPGGELFGLLSRIKRFSEDQAKFYAAQMILALEHLHGKDIVYRDLKPENVLIDSDGYLKLTDFGLSKMNMKEDKLTFSMIGTLEYLAPEILLKKGYGKPVDWWCLGSLLYEMIVGLTPFHSRNNNELYDKIKYTQPTIPIYVSDKLKDLLLKLFQKQPKLRLGTKDGSVQIKSHPWFEGFDWKSLSEKTMKAPFVPHIKSKQSKSDQSINPTFTKEDLSSQNSLPCENNDKKYQDFQFNQSNKKISQGELIPKNIKINIQKTEEKTTEFMKSLKKDVSEEQVLEERKVILQQKKVVQGSVVEQKNIIEVDPTAKEVIQSKISQKKSQNLNEIQKQQGQNILVV